jgi:hypothetical protein
MWTLTRGTDKLSAMIIPSMRNIEFKTGFIVDREKLDRYLSSRKDISCIVESESTYTRIRIPLTEDISSMKTIKVYMEDNGKWNITDSTYQEYLDILPEKDRKSKMKKLRYNTFLVFYSGSVIMTGITREYMKDVYKQYSKIFMDGYDSIVEKLDPID